MTTNDIKTLSASDESRTLEPKNTTGELKDEIHERKRLSLGRKSHLLYNKVFA